MHKMKARTLLDLVRMADELRAQGHGDVGHWHRAQPDSNFVAAATL
jgi:hypothetical protein